MRLSSTTVIMQPLDTTKDVSPWPSTRGCQLIAIYFLVEALATIAWWIGILNVDSFRRIFFAESIPVVTLYSLLAGDVCFYVIGSLICAWSYARSFSWSRDALCIFAGATGYATAFSIMQGFLTGSGQIGVYLMILSFAFPCLLLASYWPATRAMKK